MQIDTLIDRLPFIVELSILLSPAIITISFIHTNRATSLLNWALALNSRVHGLDEL